MGQRQRAILLAAALIATACTGPSSGAGNETAARGIERVTTTQAEPPAAEPTLPPIGGTSPVADALPITPVLLPPAPDTMASGPLDPEIAETMQKVFSDGGLRWDFVEDLGATGDIRLAWPVSDAFRFVLGGEFDAVFLRALENLTGQSVAEQPAEITANERDFGRAAWLYYQDLLLAWDVPPPPGYLEFKRNLYVRVDAGWESFFDPASPLDWREVNSGGVRKDGIPSLNDPTVTSGDDTGWSDDAIVFGMEVDGETRAYPRVAMEVHEMVNDTVGGRRIALPYCTLCKSATGYLTDEPPDGFETIDLRTSGLLRLSNKLMYDVATDSLFDQFFGKALTGPLREAGFELSQIPVVTTTWGDWRAAYPDSTIITTDAGGDPDDYIRDSFLDTRDVNGPNYPVGQVDDRLGVHTTVLGVESPSGTAIAFPVDLAKAELAAGRPVEFDGVEVVESAGGIAARVAGTEESVDGHESFWFAWAQFRADTEIWAPNQ